MLQHFFIEGKHYGTTERQQRHVHAEVQWPYSFAYVCPYCGELWARAALERKNEQWQVQTLPCRKHQQETTRIPGSLILSWDPEYNEAFPPEVLVWEFERHLDYAERKTQT